MSEDGCEPVRDDCWEESVSVECKMVGMLLSCSTWNWYQHAGDHDGHMMTRNGEMVSVRIMLLLALIPSRCCWLFPDGIGR